MGRKMILHEGVYYSAEDLKALKQREADEAKREKLQKAADKLAAGEAAACECSERLEKLENLVAEAVDALGDRITALEDAASGGAAAADAAVASAEAESRPKSTRAKKEASA